MTGVRAIVSLGSNIEPRAEYLSKALECLAALPGTTLEKASRVAETEPVDVPPEFADMWFLNQVAQFSARRSTRMSFPAGCTRSRTGLDA